MRGYFYRVLGDVADTAAQYPLIMLEWRCLLLSLGEQVEDEILLGILETSALQIYAGIQARLGNGAECDAMRVMLEDSACIWTGRGFVAADCVLMELQHDFTPYLYRVPDVAAPYKQLLAFLGVCCLTEADDTCHTTCIPSSHRLHSVGYSQTAPWCKHHYHFRLPVFLPVGTRAFSFKQVADHLTIGHATRALHSIAKEQGPTPISQRQLSMVVQLGRSLMELKAKGATIHDQVSLVTWHDDMMTILRLSAEVHSTSVTLVLSSMR